LTFAVGTLPLSAIWSFVRQRANLQIDEGKHWESDLYLVQGLTTSARDRLIAEDIDSVQRLAFADPIRLLFRTNIEWNVLLDAVDQALLIDYAGEKITKVRDIGIRGAIEMAELTERDKDDNTKWEIGHASRMLDLVGSALGHDHDAAYNLSYQLANDPVVLFVWENYDANYSKVRKQKPDTEQASAPRRFRWLLDALPFMTDRKTTPDTVGTPGNDRTN
jgi:hypothetical protein